MTETVIIKSRFHGPPASGNGGYSCAMLGRYIDGPTAVRLHVPPPLDTPMEVRRKNGVLELLHGEVVVASARPAAVDLDVPRSPSFADARAASHRFRGFESHFYPGCFVCGPEREPGDGLRIFPGPVEGGLVAAAWIPDASLADSSGFVAPEYLWASLDCPGAYSFPEPRNGTILLGELAVSINGRVRAGEKCVLTGWEVRHEGRRHYTGTALFGESGACQATGYATWFEVASSYD